VNTDSQTDVRSGHDTTVARQADNIDRHVGSRIRQYRRLLNLSQQDMGEKIGISYQQIQKYESGVNRISAGRLFMFAEILEVPIQKFYEGINTAIKGRNIAQVHSLETLLENPETKDAIEKLVDSILKNSQYS